MEQREARPEVVAVPLTTLVRRFTSAHTSDTDKTLAVQQLYGHLLTLDHFPELCRTARRLATGTFLDALIRVIDEGHAMSPLFLFTLNILALDSVVAMRLIQRNTVARLVALLRARIQPMVKPSLDLLVVLCTLESQLSESVREQLPGSMHALLPLMQLDLPDLIDPVLELIGFSIQLPSERTQPLLDQLLRQLWRLQRNLDPASQSQLLVQARLIDTEIWLTRARATTASKNPAAAAGSHPARPGMGSRTVSANSFTRLMMQ